MFLQVIAKIALCELPVEGQWPDLIQLLNNNVVGQGAAATSMHGSLVTLGYICQVNKSRGKDVF